MIPFLTFWLHSVGSYEIFIIGGIITSLSPLVFVIGPSYYTIVSFIVLTSIGESFYAPRLIDYCLEIAPKGKESGVIAITYLPAALSAAFTGLVSGILFNAYCPDEENNNEDCSLVWVFVFVYSFLAVAALFFCKMWLEQPFYESQPYVNWAKEANKN